MLAVGVLLFLAEAAFLASLLLDGLVMPVAWWDRWWPPALHLAAAGLVLLRAMVGRRRRRPWAVVGAGLLCSAAGDLYYSVVLFGRADALFPSVADGMWLASYSAYYVGLVLLVRDGCRQFHSSMWLDGVVAGFGVAAIGALAFGPIAAGAQPGAPLVLLIAYPAGDLLMVSLFVGVVAAGGWRLTGPWALLAMGCVVAAAADTGFLLLAATGHYTDGSIVDAMWPAAYLLLAAAAWQDRFDVEPVRLEGGRVLVVPVLVTLASLLVLLGDAVAAVPLVAQLLAAGGITAVLVRTALTFREVASLAETRRAARTDDLTGLSNRRDFYLRVNAATTNHSATGPTRSVVLLIDLDRFKAVNDSLGHHVGDELLVLVGRELSELVRDTDTVARLGGDEFAVLLEDAGLDEADRMAEQMRERLCEPFVVGPSTLHISGSIGIAAHPDHAEDVQGLLRCADTAMYAAKAAGGVQIYDPASRPNGRRDLQTVHELRAVIDTMACRAPAGPGGELLLRYQPKLDLRTGRVTDFEVLVRWRHPRCGTLPPDEFLPLVEQAGLMPSLTDVVLRQALEQCSAWRRAGRELTVAVNISPTCLSEGEFSARIAAVLNECGLPPSALVMEITESAVMTDRERCFDMLNAVHAIGVRISIDDFGTGYSSLAYLQDLPVDELKLDRRFIARMVGDPRTAAIVRSTIGLAHSLGVPLVAEGVQTLPTLHALAAAGCDYGQGYLIAEPLPADDVAGWLDRKAWLAEPVPGRASGAAPVEEISRCRCAPRC